MMLWLGAFLLIHAAVAIDPSKWSMEEAFLGVNEKSEKYYTSKPAAPVSSTGGNGFPRLGSKNKAFIEQCVIDPFLISEKNCGNNPYAGLLRLAFHDCGTYDKTASKDKGGCNAWMTKKCTQFDQCEYQAPENNGLKLWVDPLDKAYDTAQVNGKPLSSYLSRADFWHLAAFRALRQSSGFKVSPDYNAGRVDPVMPEPGPRFRGRLPDAFAWSEMQRIARRNGIDDITAAALLGAHTLGQCHATTSGYQGAWDPTPMDFDELFWDGLLDLKWYVHEINAINNQTKKPTSKIQFSLGGDNYDRSAMLFSDMGMHLLIDQCDWENEAVAKGKCSTNKNPFDLPNALRTWADQPATFFAAFANSWEIMSRWGCSTCYDVDEYLSRVDCSSVYKHSCQQNYKEGTSYWKPGWKTPVPPPTYSTQKPATRPPYGQTTPRPTTRSPYTPTTKPPYKPTTKPPYKPTTKPPYTPTTKPPYTKPPYTTPTYPPTTTPKITGTITKSPPKDTTTCPPTTTPETTPPETTYPETTPPETTYPETTPPETTYPETTPYVETTTYPPPTTSCPTPSPTYPPPPTTTACPTPSPTYPPPPTTTTCPTPSPTYPPPPTTTACPTPSPTYPPPPTTTTCPTPSPTYPPPPTTTTCPTPSPTYPPPPTTTTCPTPSPTSPPTYRPYYGGSPSTRPPRIPL